jgi:hypothetical protein
MIAYHQYRAFSITFWFLAGLWNVLIASIFWKNITKHSTELKKDIFTRSLVFVFGLGYWLVGYNHVYFRYIILAGIVAKLGVVISVIFDKLVAKKKVPNILIQVVFGDFLWVLAFSIYFWY